MTYESMVRECRNASLKTQSSGPRRPAVRDEGAKSIHSYDLALYLPLHLHHSSTTQTQYTYGNQTVL